MNGFTFTVAAFLAERFGKEIKSDFCRVYANADRHWYHGKEEVRERIVTLYRQVRQKTTYTLFGREIYWEEGPKQGEHETLSLSEVQEPGVIEQLAMCFLIAANPEKLPWVGETSEEDFPELTRRAVAFLTKESDVFEWGGFMIADSKGSRSRIQLVA